VDGKINWISFVGLNPIKLLKDLQSTANQVHENETRSRAAAVAVVVAVAVGRKEVRLLLFPGSHVVLPEHSHLLCAHIS